MSRSYIVVTDSILKDVIKTYKMAEKRKSKFTVTGSASQPINVAPYYQCDINVPGEWKTADRNNTSDSDQEGWGKKGVLVFYPTSGSKLCAPNPPFNTNDGGFNLRALLITI